MLIDASYISKHCPFYIPKEKPITLSHYSPRKLINVRTLDNLPPSLTHLIFHPTFNSPLQSSIIPSSVTHLAFGDYFDKPIDHLPSSLTHLEFTMNFKQVIHTLPPNLTHLTLSNMYNSPLTFIPPNLQYLRFGIYFDKSVDILAQSKLIHLIFGHCFNQPINHLPNTLTHLVFGRTFSNHFVIPPNLTFLSLGNSNLNKKLGNLPSRLSSLLLYSKHVEVSVPIQVSALAIINDKHEDFSSYLHLEHLRLYVPLSLGHYPPHITHLSITSREQISDAITLPPTVTHFACTSRTINCTLPPKLVYLKVHIITTTTFPSSLKYLRMETGDDDSFDHFHDLTHAVFYTTGSSLPCTLPPSITHLRLIGNFNSVIKEVPSTLTHLQFGNKFDQPLDFLSSLTCLKYVRFGRLFRHSLRPLPSSVILLDIYRCYYNVLDAIPKSLKYLSFDIDQHRGSVEIPPHVRVLAHRFPASAFMYTVDDFLPWIAPKYCASFGYESRKYFRLSIDLAYFFFSFGYSMLAVL